MPPTLESKQHAPLSLLLYSEPPRDGPSLQRVAAAVTGFHVLVLCLLVWLSTLEQSILPVGPGAPGSLETDYTMLLIGSTDGQPAAAARAAARSTQNTAPVRTLTAEPAAEAPATDEPALLGQPVAWLPEPPAVVPTSIPEPALQARTFEISPDFTPPALEARPPAGARSARAGASDGPAGNGNGVARGNGADADGLALDELAREPRFTPFTQAPELINRAEIKSFLQRRYPAYMSARGVGGRAVLWILIDQKGGIRKGVLLRSSGNSTLDDAALEAIDRMEFRPAVNKGQRVPVWVQLPVSFQPDW